MIIYVLYMVVSTLLATTASAKTPNGTLLGVSCSPPLSQKLHPKSYRLEKIPHYIIPLHEQIRNPPICMYIYIYIYTYTYTNRRPHPPRLRQISFFNKARTRVHVYVCINNYITISSSISSTISISFISIIIRFVPHNIIIIISSSSSSSVIITIHVAMCQITGYANQTATRHSCHTYQMELGYDNWYDNSMAGGSQKNGTLRPNICWCAAIYA